MSPRTIIFIVCYKVDNKKEMAHYTIKDLEQLSGIKAHTIRIWEKRYDLLKPERTETNIRRYGDDDLRMLLNISVLKKAGVKISNISCLSTRELRKLVEKHSCVVKDQKAQVDRLTIDMIGFDEKAFVERMDDIISKHGVLCTFRDIIYPFLERIGILWQVGSITPAQEHFVSNYLRNKLIIEASKIDANYNSEERFLLFLPENELHEIGLLLYYYLLRKKGAYVLYLGQNCPVGDVIKVLSKHSFTATISAYVSSPSGDKLEETINYLHEEAPEVTHYLTGFQAAEYKKKTPENTCVLRKVTDLSLINH